MESESVGSWTPPLSSPSTPTAAAAKAQPWSPLPKPPLAGAQQRSLLRSPEGSAEARAKHSVEQGCCFGCKQEGHWLRDCPSTPPRRELASPGGTAGDWPELPCPCGAGPCLVLMSRTPRNPNRWFCRCPVKQAGNQCSFFKWCDTLASGVDQLHGFASPVKPEQKYGVKKSAEHARKCDFKRPINLDQHHGVSEGSYPNCACGAGKCKILTRSDGDNAGRKYFACPIKKGQGACSFFQWVDSHGTKISNIGENDLPKFGLLPVETGVPADDKASKPLGVTKLEAVVLNAADQQVFASPHNVEPRANVMAGLSPMRKLNLDEAGPATSPNSRGCFRCGQDGHWMRDCTTYRTCTCFKCGKVGHWKKDCTS